MQRTLWLLIGLLLLGGRTTLAGPREEGQLRLCRATLRVISSSIEMYAADHSSHYPAALAELTPKYLAVLPSCPAGGTYAYTRSPDGKDFVITCTGGDHAGLPDGYPRYGTTTGVLIGPGQQDPLDHVDWLVDQGDKVVEVAMAAWMHNHDNAAERTALNHALDLYGQARNAMPSGVRNAARYTSRIEDGENQARVLLKNVKN